MFKKISIASTLLAALAITPSFAVYQNPDVTHGTVQQISVTNMLWNENATGSIQGLTPTSVVVAFNNGGSKPCFSTTLAFQGFINLIVGTGQSCVAAVTSVTVTPVAGPAGAVYTTPSALSLNSSYFTNQIIITDDTDPVFDTTNGLVKTGGTVKLAYQGQLRT